MSDSSNDLADLVLSANDFNIDFDTNDLDLFNNLTPACTIENNYPHVSSYTQSLYSPSSLCDITSVESSAASTTSKRKYTTDSGVLSDDFDAVNAKKQVKTERKINFTKFKAEDWVTAFDEKLNPIERLEFMIEADKGFVYSSFDNAFICQKKNHFQITAHTYVNREPKYFKRNNQLTEIISFQVNLYGVKRESEMQRVAIKESDKDRKLFDFKPCACHLHANQINKQTMRRLHFSQTTSNNNRKKNKSNPDQRYFLLVVEMQLIDAYGNEHTLYAAASEELIVRAVNPGQYSSNQADIKVEEEDYDDVRVSCSPSDKDEEQITCLHGNVGINTLKPDQALSVHGNISLTGSLLQPSDVRIKKNISPKSTSDSLDKIRNLKLYNYDFIPEYYDLTGVHADSGVLAQELQEVIPEAVQETGNLKLSSQIEVENFLNVDKSKIFMECVGAVQELDKKTENMDTRIDKLEKVVELVDEEDTSSQRNILTAPQPRRVLKIGMFDCSWINQKNLLKKRLSGLLVGCALMAFVITIAVILTIQMLNLRRQNEDEFKSIWDLYNSSKNDSFIYPKLIPPALVPGFCQREPEQCKISCCDGHMKPHFRPPRSTRQPRPPRPPRPPPLTKLETKRPRSTRISPTMTYNVDDYLDSIMPYPIVKVRVVSFDIDVTLSEDSTCSSPYCEEIDGKFVYYVPLSHFLVVTAPVDLIFDVKYGYTFKNCEMKHGDVLCQQSPDYYVPSALTNFTSKIEVSTRLLDITRHIVKTPAAFFLHSDLIFRVAFENGNADVCSNSYESTISKSVYREVIFRIFRICGN